MIRLQIPPTMFDRQMYYFHQLLNVHGVNEFRQAEIHMAELLVLKASASDIETAIEKLVRYKSSGVVYVPAELKQKVGQNVLRSIHLLLIVSGIRTTCLSSGKESNTVTIYKGGKETAVVE